MKLKPYFTALLVFGLAVVAVVYAQQIRLPDASAMLNQATAMLAQGKPQDALALLAKIPATDVGYGQAKGYDALCLYALKDGKKFLQAVDKPEVQAAKLPAAIREELDFAQIDTLFSIGKFSEAAHKALDFQENHPGSEQSGNVMEHLSAALFTQGMRDVYRACSLKDDQQFKSSWLRGQSNLVQFQTVAAALGKTGYQILPKRDLRTEVWTARIALGDETNVLREIAGQSRGDMEEALFMNVELHQRLQPRAADENLRRIES